MQRVVTALIFASLSTHALSNACVDAVPDRTRSDVAIRALAQLGADIQYRDEPGGTGKIILATNSNWRGADAGLVYLKDVAGLYKLRLAGDISDAGLARLAEVCGLTSLDVHIISITDAGVRELQTLTRLQRLNLTYTKVTDSGLASLTGLTNLKWLGLSYTRVTHVGIEKLRRSLSGTIIEGNPQR